MLISLNIYRCLEDCSEKLKDFIREKKTSMMWPSQNFLLYNGTIIKMKVTEWKNNLRKYVPPPPFGDIYNMYKL